MQYDGSGKLGSAIAGLCGLSPKSSMQIAVLIKQAKDALGITSKAKNLPDDVKLAIWQWHYDRLNPVYNVKQGNGDGVYNVKQTDDDKLDLIPDRPVYNVKRDDAVYDVKQADDGGVYNVKQSDDFSQAHFAVTVAGKRTTVMLEGYLVTALQCKHGLTDNTAIRAWIGQAIKNDDVRFDADAPLTRQVKRLIVESFV